ncbi:hypothetical protein ACJX0J_039336 [Zea mays]
MTPNVSIVQKKFKLIQKKKDFFHSIRKRRVMPLKQAAHEQFMPKQIQLHKITFGDTQRMAQNYSIINSYSINGWSFFFTDLVVGAESGLQKDQAHIIQQDVIITDYYRKGPAVPVKKFTGNTGVKFLHLLSSEGITPCCHIRQTRWYFPNQFTREVIWNSTGQIILKRRRTGRTNLLKNFWKGQGTAELALLGRFLFGNMNFGTETMLLVTYLYWILDRKFNLICGLDANLLSIRRALLEQGIEAVLSFFGLNCRKVPH